MSFPALALAPSLRDAHILYASPSFYPLNAGLCVHLLLQCRWCEGGSTASALSAAGLPACHPALQFNSREPGMGGMRIAGLWGHPLGGVIGGGLGTRCAEVDLEGGTG